MARFGKKPLFIPEGVQVKTENKMVKCKGPKGELSFELDKNLKIEEKENKIFLSQIKKSKKSETLLGTSRSLIANMLQGVKEGYEKKLEIIGVGFKAQAKGKKLVLYLGFAQPVEVEATKDIEFKVQKNIVSIFGINKHLVGEVAAKIKRLKPPEPYKGKGIRYLGEYVRKKLGKKAVATTGAA